LRIGILAGEASGDILGAALCRELQDRGLVEHIVGVGGQLMQAAGCDSLFDMERLSVMGLVEPLKRLPELLNMRRALQAHFIESAIDVFIGIDSPDFNLTLERNLRGAGIPVVHMVSPSVWAWRSGRIHKIGRSVDLMLTLFPFELDIYRQHNIAAVCIGHPLADQLPLEPDPMSARRDLNLSDDRLIIGLLPGSRAGEVALLGKLFIDAARLCRQKRPELQFLLPAANAARYAELEAMLADAPDVPVKLILGDAQKVMAACDALIMASGTATLEAMLLKKPMVVAYRMGAVSYALISRLLHTPYVALPNLLAGEMMVPELLQENATAPALAEAVLTQLESAMTCPTLLEKYQELHHSLQSNAGAAAADAILAVPGVCREGINGPV
jgi:lipid-A-disaccharide synthase